MQHSRGHVLGNSKRRFARLGALASLMALPLVWGLGCRGPTFQVFNAFCEPQDGAQVDPECGMFVDVSASAGGDGSQESPFNKISDAIAAGATNIYVCNSDDAPPLSDRLEIDPGVRIYGGLLCDEWLYDFGRRTSLTAPAGTIPVVLKNGGGARLVNFRILAPNGVAPGGSSIAILADAAVAELTRVVIETGNGADGEPGAPGTQGASAMGGSDTINETGGTGGQSSRACGRVSDGGAGAAVGATAGEGMPDQGNAGTSGEDCTPGQPGVTPSSDIDGAHAALGDISASGYTPANNAMPGGLGAPGGGGGGGGASALGGGGGGGGGAGSCGGTGGQPGTSGGSSIGIVWLPGTNLTFQGCEAKIGNGGNGGPGGEGGLGGEPGKGGVSMFGCNGGDGARGQTGGAGGSGAGGFSLIIAYRGDTTPDIGQIAFVLTGKAGEAGALGGKNGHAGPILQFPVE